jgi:hypothetical protein
LRLPPITKAIWIRRHLISVSIDGSACGEELGADVATALDGVAEAMLALRGNVSANRGRTAPPLPSAPHGRTRRRTRRAIL